MANSKTENHQRKIDNKQLKSQQRKITGKHAVSAVGAIDGIETTTNKQNQGE